MISITFEKRYACSIHGLHMYVCLFMLYLIDLIVIDSDSQMTLDFLFEEHQQNDKSNETCI